MQLDLFKQKIVNTPITTWRENYTGDNNAEAVLDYIKQEFPKCCNNGKRAVVTLAGSLIFEDGCQELILTIEKVTNPGCIFTL